jgi:uncharacterized membrane protein
MVLIGLLGTSWGLRLQEGDAAVLPWGLVLSWISLGAVAVAGWHGGKLVFEHQVGIAIPEDDEEEAPGASETSGSSPS